MLNYAVNLLIVEEKAVECQLPNFFINPDFKAFRVFRLDIFALVKKSDIRVLNISMRLLSLKPYPIQKTLCPQCGEKTVFSSEVFFQGIHVLKDCHCQNCDLDFWETLPTGHTIDKPLVVNKANTELIGIVEGNEWLAQALIRSLDFSESESIYIQRDIRRSSKKIILLNCLDDCFGHVFNKLWNACFVEDGYEIVVLIPSQCAWMVPDEVAEIWTVPIEVSEIGKGIPGLHQQLKGLLEQYEEVFLHPAFVHLDHLKIPFDKILKTSRFPLPEFLVRKPKIGFVLREDRFWLNSSFFEFLFLVSKKFKVFELFRPIFLWRQKQLVVTCAKLLEKSFPGIELYVSGLGNSGTYPKRIEDLRVDQILSEKEQERISVYAETHLIIGVHGSHLLVPTGLAAGYININPRYKTAHWVEDTILPYRDRMQQFLGRKLDQKSSPSLIVHHIKSVFENFEYVWRRLNEAHSEK
ncbi:MAG: hypothetical protein EA341_11930 [Mongoliibacter sp.]|nr:MAG: hypothetical protein EA341_11930 [Mongoliibacter sp.]